VHWGLGIQRGLVICRAEGDLVIWIAHYYGVREVTHRRKSIGDRRR